ncbi:MAG: 3-deoxy-D-manno-octulosonic acid transferase [Gammaproteobacteria bacterium]|nr:MAG: 3-deoxy-D-manno-octulosonic acid transferase [Gammaproteobacteria bacterium]
MSRGLYSLLMYLMVPLFLWRLLRRGFRLPEYWQRWPERFGYNNLEPIKGSVWIHAVSVGEVQAAIPLVEHFLAKPDALPVVLTTMTPTGSSRVQALFGDRLQHVYAPYDLPDAVNRFLNKIQPRQVVIMETEIWPNMISWCFKRHVPIVLANARLSERSARGYKKVARLSRLALSRITCIAAQSEADKQRFLEIGADEERIDVTGSIKLDINMPPSVREQRDVIRRRLGSGRKIWVAASTHEGEEEQVLDAYSIVRKQTPDALLVLVPRHPERAEQIESLCNKRGYQVTRRTQEQPTEAVSDIYMVDTLGELSRFFSAADVAYIGGSLVPVGGHNMVEASAQGIAVVFGPHLFNFAEISQQLLDADAARKVEDSNLLAAITIQLLNDANLRHQLGQNGQEFVESNRGALQQLLSVIDDCVAR